MDAHPTIFHFVEGIRSKLDAAGFNEITERDLARLRRGGKYYLTRNGTSLVAFRVGLDFVPGPDAVNVVASHIDANRLTLKPSSIADSVMGYLQIATAPYADGGNNTWWDRDLGLGGRVIVKRRGAVFSKIIRLPGIVGSTPTLAPHFGAMPTNLEQMPVVSTLGREPTPTVREKEAPLYGKHSLRLLRAVAKAAFCEVDEILEWDLEMFSAESARIGGLDEDLLYCSRMDDKLCSYSAIEGLISASEHAHLVQMVALYDNEEIGSETRQGARGNLLDVALAAVFSSLNATTDERRQTIANSYLVSADVTHAGNPNYAKAYLENHVPLLNIGVAVKRLGRFAGSGVDAGVAQLVSARCDQKLQYFAPRNDTRTGGTIGPMLAAHTGMPTVDVGIPIMSMHSIREITGVHDVELGKQWFATFLAEPIYIAN